MIMILDEKEFENLTAFVKVNYGMDLSNRRAFVEMRIDRMMRESGYTDFTEYFNYVCSDFSGTIISNFISNLTINHTLFYRESMHYEFLRDKVLPELYAKEQEKKDLRIWSAGCSSGEEPYTIAMVVADFLGINKPNWNMQILATDLSVLALRHGIEASYPRESIDELSPQWVKSYFQNDPKNTENVLVRPIIKDEVVFRRLNLIGDTFNFKNKFHFIFCRNVMIYFDESTKNNLIRKYYDLLEVGGYLFIGMSETIDKSASDFKYVLPSIYRKG